jgi:hypothetical protein
VSLREQVARRLHTVRESGPFGHGESWEVLTGIGQDAFRTLADEVIRLMEWARRNCVPQERLISGPLTLPPDDWKP